MALRRDLVLAGLLAALLFLTYLVLSAVVQTMLFAVTVAYVLFPVREWLRARGLSRRLASLLTTAAAFLALLLLFVPFAFAVYRRREAVREILDELPETVTIDLGAFEYEAGVADLQAELERVAGDVAVDVALQAPSLALAVALFVIVLFGLLYKPRAPGHSIYAIVPREYHDIIRRLDERTASVLYSLYVIQALTAVATFVVAVVLFWALGYAAPVWLGLFAGILQFIPIVGPSVLVVGLATLDVAVLDMPLRAVAVLVLGLLFVAMAPDVTIRPKLASRTGDFSSTLYFVGFVGGLLTLGAVGIIVGPLVVALLVEVLDIIAEEGSDGDGKDGGGLGGGETDSGGEGPEANPENPEREVPT